MTDSIQDDPKIVKIAKLVLILVDKTTETSDKVTCIKMDIANGLITNEEALQLLAWLPELQEFL